MGRMSESGMEEQQAAHDCDSGYFIDKMRRENNDRLDKVKKDLELLEKEMTLLMDLLVKLTDQVTKLSNNES